MKIVDLEEVDGVFVPVEGSEHIIIDPPTPVQRPVPGQRKKFVAVLMEKNQRFSNNFKQFLSGIDAVISITSELRKRARKVQ